jgi:hypothetical protein
MWTPGALSLFRITVKAQGRNTSCDSSALNNELEKNSSRNWTKVYYNKEKYSKCPVAQQPQPILTIVNCFSLLDNLQQEPEDFRFQDLVENAATVKNKNKHASKPQRNKILITGDSHTQEDAQLNCLIHSVTL